MFEFWLFNLYGFQFENLILVHRLPQLKMLDVSFNSIVNIPEEIGSAMSLVKYAELCVIFS